MTRLTRVATIVLLAGLAGTQAAPVIPRAITMEAGPSTPIPPAPSPTGWPPGPSIKTITHTSTAASNPPSPEGTAGSHPPLEGQALAVGPPGAFYSTHALNGTSNGTDGTEPSDQNDTIANATSMALMGDDGPSLSLSDMNDMDSSTPMDEEDECEDDEPMTGAAPSPGAAASAQGVMVVPPVPKAPGSNETIPLTPSPVQPDADAAASDRPSGMENFLSAGGSGMAGMGTRGLFMRDLRRSRQTS